MRKVPILQPNQSYTFRSYYEMPYEPEEILAEFGYSLQRSNLTLPQSKAELDRLTDFKLCIGESLPK